MPRRSDTQDPEPKHQNLGANSASKPLWPQTRAAPEQKSPTLVPTGRVVDSDRAGFRVRRTFMLGFHRASDLGRISPSL